MKRITYEIILRAAEPIAHHSETLGNAQVLMRQKVRQPDGDFARVPVVTGDTMRHKLREAAAYATLDAAGMLEGRPVLSESALRLLFAGGAIVAGSDGSTVKLDDYARMVDLFPPLALLGGCAGGRCIPGRMQVGPAVLICEEARALLPEWAVEYSYAEAEVPQAERAGLLGRELPGAREHVEVETRVRMDPMLSPSHRRLLTDESRAKVEGRLLARSEADGDARKVEASKSAMMPRSYEVVSAGSLWWWSVSATTYGELDEGCLHTMLAAALYEMRVGGKQATGHGLMRAVHAREGGWLRPREQAVGAINPNAFERLHGAAYRAHVEERGEQLREWLESVKA